MAFIYKDSSGVPRSTTSASVVGDDGVVLGSYKDSAGVTRPIEGIVLVDAAGNPVRSADADPTALAAWRLAKAQVATGEATVARVAFWGDSKTVGAGAGTGTKFTDGAFIKSRPAVFGKELEKAGFTVCYGFGGFNGLTLAEKAAYDPRLTFGSGWTGLANVLGGGGIGAPAGSGALTFAPEKAYDRLSLFYNNSNTRPTLTVTVGVESKTIVASGTARELKRADLSFSALLTQAASITRPATGNTGEIYAGVAWRSDLPYIEVMNFGIYGAVTSALAVEGADSLSPLPALRVYRPHLLVVNLGTNDLNSTSNVTLGAHLTALRAIIESGKQVGASVAITFPAIGAAAPAYGDVAKRNLWRAAQAAMAAELGCWFGDEELLLGGRNAAAHVDGVHEKASAYYVEAMHLYRATR